MVRVRRILRTSSEVFLEVVEEILGFAAIFH